VSALDRTRLNRHDGRFIAICLLVVLAGSGVALLGYSRAFPEASIDFQVTRKTAVEIARASLTARGFDLTGYRSLVVFDHDDTAKVFLERTLGLARANPLFAAEIPVWRWSVRFVKPMETLEYLAYVSPKGELQAFRRVLPEAAAANAAASAAADDDPGDEKAARLAEVALSETRGVEPVTLRFLERSSEQRPRRVDRTFVWEATSLRFEGGGLRYRIELQGSTVGRSSVYYEVPEKWKTDYRTLRSKNEAAGAVATLGMAATWIALLAVLVARMRRRDVKWRLALTFGAVGFLLQLASSLNELPVRLFDYDTTESWAAFLTKSILLSSGGALALGLSVAILVAGGEPVYREAFADKPALGLIFSRQGLQTRRFFRGLLLGYALTGFFLAYQVAFYLVAERFGAWAPADVPYSDLLGTALPWLGVLIMGFAPATVEEFTSRMFSIPFAARFMPRWAAVVVPALIWGFAHSAYPNQPFYVRGVEVGIAGIVVGAMLLKFDLFPLLVWHFTVDAVYTSMLLVRSSNPYFVVTGAAAALVLLVPLVVSIALYVRNKGFLPDELILNAVEGSAPPRVEKEEPAPSSFAAARPLDGRLVAGVAAVALVLLGAWRLLPRAALTDGPTVNAAAAKWLADKLMLRVGERPYSYYSLTTVGSVLPAIEGSDESGAELPYGWSDHAAAWILEKSGLETLSRWATPAWQTWYFRPQDRHSARVFVDGRTQRPIAIRRTFPDEEAGARLDEKAALARAYDVLQDRGYQPPPETLVSSKAKDLKARRDYTFVFETAKESVAGANRRLIVRLAGAETAQLTTAIKLPEAFVRGREEATPIHHLARVWKVVGIGAFLTLLVAAFVRHVRGNAVPWKRLSRVAIVLTVPSLLKDLVALPLALRAYQPEYPMAVFATFASVGFVLGVFFSFGGALLALVFVNAVRPDALTAFGKGAAPRGPRTLVAAGLGTLLVVAASLFGRNLAAAWPLAAGFSGFAIPPGIETALPAVDVLQSAVAYTLLLAGGAALLALLLRDLLQPTAVKAVAVLLLVGVFVPFQARTAPELLVPLLSRTVVAAALLAALACLLRDDPRSYLATALLLAAVRGALPLIRSDVTSWRFNGLGAAAVLLLALAFVAFPRRSAAPA